MFYITRNRFKESLKSEDLIEVNKLIDTEIIPAVLNVEGVRSAQGYNSITGDLTFIIDAENLATVDRIMADQGCRAVLGKINRYAVRIGGEVLYDRPTWQELYRKS